MGYKRKQKEKILAAIKAAVIGYRWDANAWGKHHLNELCRYCWLGYSQEVAAVEGLLEEVSYLASKADPKARDLGRPLLRMLVDTGVKLESEMTALLKIPRDIVLNATREKRRKTGRYGLLRIVNTPPPSPRDRLVLTLLPSTTRPLAQARVA